MGDDLTFDQLWVAGDDNSVVYGGIDIGDIDEDAVILDNPKEEMNRKRKMGAGQASVKPTRVKHAPKNRLVPLTNEQVEKKKAKIEKLKAKKKKLPAKPQGTNAKTVLKVLTEPADRQADYFWSEYCASIGGELSISEIESPLSPSGVLALGVYRY